MLPGEGVRVARDPFLAACESTAGPDSLAALAFTDAADAARFCAAQAACQELPTRDLCLAPQLGFDGTALSAVSGSTTFSQAASAGMAADITRAAFLRSIRELLGALRPHAACAKPRMLTRAAWRQPPELACVT